MKKSVGINNVFNSISDGYKKNFGAILGYTILLQIMMAVITYILNLVFYFFGVLVTTPMILMDNKVWGIVSIVSMFLVLMSVTLIMAQFVKVGHIKAVIDVKAGLKVSFDKMFTYTFSHGKYIISSTFIYSLIFSVIVVIAGVALVGTNVMLLSNGDGWMLLVTNILLGGIILAILLIFFVRTFYYLPIAVIEKKHFFRPLIDSVEMTKKEGRRLVIYVFSLFSATVVITLGITGVVSIIFSILTAIIGNGNPGLMAVMIVISYILLMIVIFITSIVVTPIQFMFIGAVYVEERDRKYGDDLFERLDKLLEQQKERFKTEISQYGETTNL